MTARKRRHGQIVHVDWGPLVSAENALKFGHSGRCRTSTCDLCLYRPICEGGTVGDVGEGGVHERREKHERT